MSVEGENDHSMSSISEIRTNREVGGEGSDAAMAGLRLSFRDSATT